VLELPVQTFNAFRRDDRGSIIPTFAVMFFFLAMTLGAAVDAARMYHSHSRLGAAADAAAIAAGKALLDGRNSNADVERIATEFFYANIKEDQGFAKIHSFSAKLDRTKNSVQIDIQADVPMTITKIAGFETVSLPVSSVAIFDQKDIEVTLALDVTGSMCMPCSKIDALKVAVGDLLDIMLPDAGTPNKVRVGFAPYSSGVNAGSYAGAATNNRSADGCTFERQGSEPEGDQAPSAGNYLKVAADVGVGNGACPASRIIALSADKTLLSRTVDGYTTGGSTAGHLGAQWASYMVSPNWGGVFGSESIPAAYNDGKTIKAVVLMTDGENNTFGGRNAGGNRARSDELERKVCAEMRANNVMVFTIGFTGPGGALDTTAQNLLKGCAGRTDHFFLARDRDELRQAFASIANQLNNLRLSK
jgi:Flp pilus assembly protein TadG